jgi:hypothetical protein
VTVDRILAIADSKAVRVLSRALVWLATIMLTLGLVLSTGVWRTSWQIPSGAIRTESGVAYVVAIRSTIPGLELYGDSGAPRRADSVFLQDGVPVGKGGALRDEIREKGGGRFSHWKRTLYFSTPDGSDPRANGHRYALVAAYSVSAGTIVLALALLALVNVLGLAAHHASIRNWPRLRQELRGLLTLEAPESVTGAGPQTLRVVALLIWAAVVFWAASVWMPALLGGRSLRGGTSWIVVLLVAASMASRAFPLLATRRRADATPGAGAIVDSPMVVPVLVVTLGALLFAQSLIHAWSSGETTPDYMGGVLPYSDAAGYYQAGLRLLYDGTLDAWHMRRPLNAALHAMRLALVGGDLRLDIALAACTAALAALLAGLEIARRLGWLGAALLLLALYSYVVLYLPSTLTSVNGFIYGALALALLLRAAESRSITLCALGVLLLGLGLNARAGPFLLLPALWLWSAVGLEQGRWSWRGLLVVVLATVTAFLVPTMFNALWGSGAGGAQSNFAYTLYGMAAGGKGWQQIYTDHPEVFTLSGEGAQSRRMVQLALQLLMTDPMPFIRFYLSELFDFIGFSRHLLSAGGVFAPLALLSGVVVALCNWRRPSASLLLLVVAGVLVSSPFLMRDGGPRVFAAAVPMLAAVGVYGATVFIRTSVYLFSQGTLRGDHPASILFVSDGALRAVALLAVMVSVFGPLAAVYLHPRDVADVVSAPPCPAGGQALVTRLGGSSYVLTVEPDDDVARSYVPRIRQSDLKAHLAQNLTDFAGVLTERKPPFAFVEGYDLSWRSNNRPSTFWALMPAALASAHAGQRVQLCGRPHPSPELSGWVNYFYDVKSVRPLPDGFNAVR